MHEKGQEPWTEIHLPRPSASYRNRHFRFTQILSFANKLLGCRSERNDAEAKRAEPPRESTGKGITLEVVGEAEASGN